MNLSSLAEKNHTHQWLKGWVFSMTFHALVVVAAMTIMPKLTLVSQKELFTWDVSLVEAPRQEPVREPSPAHAAVPKPATPKTEPTPPMPVEAYQPITRQIETRPVVETVQPEVRPVVEVVQPLQEVVKVETNSSVVVSNPEAIVSVKAIEEAVMAKAEATVVEQPAPTVAQMMPSSSVQVVHQPVGAQPVQSIVTSSASADPELPLHATGDVHETVAPAVRNPDPQVALAAKPMPSIKADYGWLAESLGRRIAALTRYPSSARLNGWEGRVVLRAVIRADGHLANVTVQKSSGYDALDRAALETIRLACPLHMKHALSASEVAVNVPIVYSLSN